ncbi:response regulator [Ascidiimonas sp. W6]|uniref:response regulator n=1 Tax=Ascidiimonas meishanensis TaxID=3128903 RepID=UPI0030EF8F50
MIRIVFAEDHNALIEGVQLFLEYEEDIEMVGFANNGKELLQLVEQKRPQVVVTDIRMPIMDGIEATKKIIQDYPQTKVIAFTMFEQDAAITEMVQAGAKGYLLKNSSLKDLLTAIRKVANGETFYDANIILPEQEHSHKNSILTKRQIEILKLIAQGKTNQEIADLLFIGRTTVETHRKNMISALGLKGSGELLRYAIEKKYNF